jgi:hypothetical protein
VNSQQIVSAPTATIDQDTLSQPFNKMGPVITGKAANASKIQINAGGLFLGPVQVVDGKWAINIANTKLTFIPGTYSIVVYDINEKNVLKTGTLVVTSAAQSVSVPGMSKYVDPTFGYSFTVPEANVVRSKSSEEVHVMNGTSTITYPNGTVEVPNIFTVEKIDYSAFSERTPIYNYVSCCSGTRYWFDSQSNQWVAQKVEAYDEHGQPLSPEKQNTPLPLRVNGVCSLEKKFGPNTFYFITSGDEGVPNSYYYLLMTDKGYALEFISKFDINGDYSSYDSKYRPSDTLLKSATSILSSLTLPPGTNSMGVTCS